MSSLGSQPAVAELRTNHSSAAVHPHPPPVLGWSLWHRQVLTRSVPPTSPPPTPARAPAAGTPCSPPNGQALSSLQAFARVVPAA